MSAADDYVRGVRDGDRVWLARAVTLVESVHPDHRRLARAVLAGLGATPAGVHRVGVTGPPGAGKSTLVDSLGLDLAGRGHRVAVLAVDPSSTRTGGSLLGDRTRMTRLAGHPDAFVRPSPSGGALGGVATTTRAVMALVEAAGFDVVLVETVGVGQSESAVADLVDTVLLVTGPGAGDELQGMKKGVLERADLVVVNKADGVGLGPARTAARELARALRLNRPEARVLTCSAREGTGVPELAEELRGHRDRLAGRGELDDRRAAQQVDWVWSLVDARLVEEVRRAPAVRAELAGVEAEARAGRTPATVLADRIVEAFRSG